MNKPVPKLPAGAVVFVNKPVPPAGAGVFANKPVPKAPAYGFPNKLPVVVGCGAGFPKRPVPVVWPGCENKPI